MPQGAPASASQRLKLQAVTKVPGFYRGPGTLNADPHICATSSWSTESAPLLPFKFLLGEKKIQDPHCRDQEYQVFSGEWKDWHKVFTCLGCCLSSDAPPMATSHFMTLLLFSRPVCPCVDFAPPIEGDTCFLFLNHQDIRNCAIGSPPCLTSIPWTSS